MLQKSNQCQRSRNERSGAFHLYLRLLHEFKSTRAWSVDIRNIESMDESYAERPWLRMGMQSPITRPHDL